MTKERSWKKYANLSVLLLISGCGMLFPKPEQVAVSCPPLPPVPLAISEYVSPTGTPLIERSAQELLELLEDMRQSVSQALKKANTPSM